MPEAPFGARRPHPVADVPPAALADGQAPAKGWLLALVAARPLRDAPALPVPDLARDAPALCAAVLRAVGSERKLVIEFTVLLTAKTMHALFGPSQRRWIAL